MEKVTGPDLDEAADELDRLESTYLEQRGWKHISNLPGNRWLWTKEIAGVRYAMTDDIAIDIQRSMDLN